MARKNKNRHKSKSKVKYKNVKAEQLAEWRASIRQHELKKSRAREFLNMVEQKIEQHLAAIENLRDQIPKMEKQFSDSDQQKRFLEGRVEDHRRAIALRAQLVEAEAELRKVQNSERVIELHKNRVRLGLES